MYQEDNFNPSDPNDYELDVNRVINETRKLDRGYNVVNRLVRRADGKMKMKNINIYTSGDMGHRIRDAETGDYYHYIVGSKDEDLFFKVGLSTGECNSLNGSNTLFYLSPKHYMDHLYGNVSDDIITKWEEKQQARLREIKNVNKKL